MTREPGQPALDQSDNGESVRTEEMEVAQRQKDLEETTRAHNAEYIKVLQKNRMNTNTRRGNTFRVADHGQTWIEQLDWSEVPEKTNFVRIDSRQGKAALGENTKIAHLSKSVDVVYLDNPARPGMIKKCKGLIDGDIAYGNDPTIIFPLMELVNDEFGLRESASFEYQPGTMWGGWNIVDANTEYPQGRDIGKYGGETPEEAFEKWTNDNAK